MTDPNPTDIFNDFKNGKLDKSSTIDKLFSILQNSKKDPIKIQIIDFFINNLLIEGFDRLKWVIINEKSADCLFEFYESLKRNNNEEARKLKNLLVDNIGEAYIERFKVNREEAFIIGLLDLPEYKVMTSEEGPWPHYITFTVEEGHVVEIYGSEIYPELNLLKAFSNLKRLIIHYSDIDDFKHLGNLKSLENLQLEYVSAFNGNGLQDISSLKFLKELHILDTTGMKFIKSMKGLENLTNLVKLSITGGETHESLGQTYEFFGEINNIENLENLINLKELKLYSNRISKIEGLDKLKNLEILDLGDNKIEKINGLRNLINLKELSLGNNQISHITGLDSLINLEILDLSNNKITKIEGLHNLKKLKKLYLDNNKLVEVQEITNLSNLEELDIRNNEIKELRGLENLKNLENLFIDCKKLKK